MHKIMDALMEQKTCVPQVEHIVWNRSPLAYIIRTEQNPDKATFLTPPEFNLRPGFVVYPQGGEIAPHVHRPLRCADKPRIDLFIPQTLSAISQAFGGFLYYG